MTEPIHLISLGAGVQSSTMAIMAAKGLITPMPSAGIFADTGSEPARVMAYLSWLETQLPFPIYRVMKKEGLRQNIISVIEGGRGRLAGAPFYTESDSDRGAGKLRRQCTREFKVEPITQRVRELVGLRKGQHAPRRVMAISWIGISTDEAVRMKPSFEYYIEHRWPLLELNMSRHSCLTWMKDNGYAEHMPAKSSCTFCPYHDDAHWRDMKMNDLESFADAVDMDRRIRAGVRGTTQKLYLHRSMKPLEEVDFRNAEDAGQMSLFNEECEGMCGV